MRARSCADLDELRSAYVDGALGDVDRERLLTHLVDCAECRRDVAELRHVRALLTGSTDPGGAPTDLSYRLVSIAGEEATEPLWTRPFRRTPTTGQLPSQRHQRQTRVLAALLGSGVAVLTILGVGYVSAPTESLAVVEPTSQAVTEFTSTVSGFPLDARVSVSLQGREPVPSRSTGYPTWLSLPAKSVSTAKAVKILVAAGRAGDETSYSATQVVTLTRDDQRLSSSVRVVNRGGAGTEIQRPPTRGTGGAADSTTRASMYVEADSSTRMADAELIERLAARYPLRGWKDQWYAGRTATVVEAVEPGTATGADQFDGVVARWWIDTETSLVLGQETYDGRGNLVTSSKLTDLDLRAAPEESAVPPRSAAQTTTTLTTSRAGDLRRRGWICAERLAGLDLLRIRTDESSSPDLVHLVYSDGLTTVSVVERRGRLAGDQAGSTRNETLGAWVTDGMPATASWTSGPVVLTVVTDGSRETLAAAVAALPHGGLDSPTTMERVRAGWSRILGR